MGKGQRAGKEEYIEYRARIPEEMYIKLLHLRVVYRKRRKARSVNDVILMAINEFLERHKEDLESADS